MHASYCMSYIIYIVNIIYNHILYRVFDLLYSIYISYISYNIGDICRKLLYVYHIIIRQHYPGEAGCNTCDPSQLHISSHFPWAAGQVETTLTPVDIGKTIAISPAFHL